MFKVQPSTVLYWVRNFALKTYEKPALFRQQQNLVLQETMMEAAGGGFFNAQRTMKFDAPAGRLPQAKAGVCKKFKCMGD